MRKNKLDHMAAGFIAGLAGFAAGFFLFAYFWNLVNHTTMKYFINEVFLGTDFYQSKIITVSILFDVLLFYIFMKAGWMQFCKGLLGVVVLAVIAVIYFW